MYPLYVRDFCAESSPAQKVTENYGLLCKAPGGRGQGEGQTEPGRTLAVPRPLYVDLKTAIGGGGNLPVMGARGAVSPHPDAMPMQGEGMDSLASYMLYPRGSEWNT
jgi:hypothetical protein